MCNHFCFMKLLFYNTVYYLFYYRDMYIKVTSQFAHKLTCFFILACISQITKKKTYENYNSNADSKTFLK